MPLANTASVLANGILSHERAAKLAHASVAMNAIQDRRDVRQVPGGLKLHQYANLYFHARNPMMYKRLEQAPDLCVLRVSCDVLSLPGVVLSDQNAASDYVRFLSPGQVSEIDMDLVYAADWRDQDRITYFRKKASKCAEVLVPNKVPSRYLVGAHVVDLATRQRLVAAGFGLPVTVSPALFFR
jgi:hypothetical protein